MPRPARRGDRSVGGQQGADPRFAAIVKASLGSGRKLDRGNANWANVCDDFGRLGISLADELRDLNPRRYPIWTEAMDRLNNARNAIAHDDRPKLASCVAIEPLTLETFRRWRSALRAVSRGMEKVLDAYLTDVLAAGRSTA